MADYGPITQDELRALVARLPDPNASDARRQDIVRRRVPPTAPPEPLGPMMLVDRVVFDLVDCEMDGRRWREWHTRDPRVVPK